MSDTLTFLAVDKCGERVEFRRHGDAVEYRYTGERYVGSFGARWKVPTWECDVFTPSERAAYNAALLASPVTP